MWIHRHFPILTALALATLAAPGCRPLPKPEVPGPTIEMPVPRPVDDSERAELEKLLFERFGRKLPSDAEFLGAGPFRFIRSSELLYIDRTDTGSIAFELADYGIHDEALEPGAIDREVLLPRIDQALERAGLRFAGRGFDSFQDEFAGAAEPERLPSDFDPRRSSLHVGRTASFARMVDEAPVFGSELVVGLMPDGSIGRFRSHWPEIPENVVRAVPSLRRAVQGQEWRVPEEMRQPGLELLEVSAGIAQTGFAMPGLRQAAVVRVLYRKRATDTEHPIASTGYRYFDAEGREVRLSVYPELPTSSEAEKGR
jgi:hypothetical protein